MLMWGSRAGEQAMATFPAGTQRAVLRLQAVREEDTGTYGCHALGPAGTAFDSTVLHVGCESCWEPKPVPQLSFLGQIPFAALRVSQQGGVDAWYKQGGVWQDFQDLGRWGRLNRWGKTRQLLLGYTWGCKVSLSES